MIHSAISRSFFYLLRLLTTSLKPTDLGHIQKLPIQRDQLGQ